MKKPILAIAVVAFLFVVVASIPVYAGVTGVSWLGATYIGRDDYYGRSVVAYEENSQAVLAVTVRNTEGTTINVTTVKANFDWGTTYISTQVSATNKVTMKNNEVRVFFINFTVPDTTLVSNLYTHSYTITVEFTGGTSSPYPYFGDDFVIYSEDQADFADLIRIISSFSPPSGGWESAKAKILWNKAANETNTGIAYYKKGDFSGAKERLSTALDHINQAWDAEEAYQTVKEELDIKDIEAKIRYLDALTSFLNGLSTMWVLFGIGGVLFSIGYVIKWLRAKRPEAATATA